MAGAKEIRTKIASVQNTQKITSAMQMVAASKMRRAQEKMSQSRPKVYATLLIILLQVTVSSAIHLWKSVKLRM